MKLFAFSPCFLLLFASSLKKASWSTHHLRHRLLCHPVEHILLRGAFIIRVTEVQVALKLTLEDALSGPASAIFLLIAS
jgi:hypothetical protein